MPAKKPSGKRVSVKAFGIFRPGWDCPDETFSQDDYWHRTVVKIAESRDRKLVVRPITISYTIPGASHAK